MWIELPIVWIVVLNVVTLPTIQLACAWAFTRLPEGWFDRASFSRSSSTIHIPSLLKTWKRWLPDGASWFAGGFHKRSLASRDGSYLRRFVSETRRGECCHWFAMILCAIPFAWNPWWGCIVIGFYAVLANLPCILLQRVNRSRLLTILSRRQASSAEAKSARS